MNRTNDDESAVNTATLTISNPTPAPAPETVAEPPNEIVNPAQLDKPAFLMNVPLSYATDVPNNPWMLDLSEEERKPQFNKALRQFLQVYHFLSAESIVYLLPAPGTCHLQDLVFTANLASYCHTFPNAARQSSQTSPPSRGSEKRASGCPSSSLWDFAPQRRRISLKARQS